MPSSARHLFGIVTLASTLVRVGGVEAQDTTRSARASEAAGEIRVDGHLDEAAWAAAVPIGALTMVEPREGEAPLAATEIRVLASPTQIYIGVRAFDDDPLGPVSHSKARDSELRSEDHVKILLDPFRDGQSGYVFAVNPGGARYDALVAEQGLGDNSSWDAIWEAATQRDSRGWTLEVRIPVRSLNFDGDLSAWGFNVERRVQRTTEVSRWASPTRDAEITQTGRAGLLSNLPRFRTGRGLTIRPAVSGGAERPDIETDWQGDGDPSLDVFQRLGSNATAAITVNTDFAETEVDTRRTNLTRFPTFFEEKRSFFLDGSDIFDFGSGLTTFHNRDVVPFFTRRIGLLAGRPVPIVAGGKVSGRAGRSSFGGLVTRTGAVSGVVDGTQMGAFRVRRNFLERSNVGALAMFGDPLGRSGSSLVGVDASFSTSRFLGSRNLLVGAWGMLTRRDDLTGDRSAFGLTVDYPNDEWDLWVSYKRLGDGFDPSLGFVPRKNVQLANLGLNYRWWSPMAGVRNFFFELVPIMAWDLSGGLESYRIFTAPLNVRLESGDRIELNVQPQGERLPEASRIANVVMPAGSYDWLRYRAEIDFAAQRIVSGRISWWFGPFYDGDVDELSVRVALNPSDLWNFELSGTRNEGYVAAGRILQEVVGARVRMNLSSDLQWSVFGQYERASDSFGMNSRLRWTFDPKGDVFVIYNYNALDDDFLSRWRMDSTQLRIKVQYAFQY